MKANEKTPLFRKPVNLIVVLVPLLLFNSVISKKCKCNKHRKIEINPPVKAPVAISFLDANRLLSIQIPNVKLTLIDKGGQVVTPNNLSFSTLEIIGGVLSLALKDSAIFNNERPYRFAIKAEAPGYSTTFQTIVVSENESQYVPVFMAKIDDPPAGMSGFTGNIPIVNSTINTDITLVPKVTNNQKRKVTVSFTQGTILLHNGKPLEKDIKSVTYNFSYASPTRLEALRTFPGGSLITDAIDNDGKVLATPGNPVLFTSAGWMNLEMNSGSYNVNGFSNPVELRIPIQDSLVNPITLRPYKVGDRIDIWSLNDSCVWKKDEPAVVNTSDDGLVAMLSIRHLTPWNLDFKIDKCTNDTRINSHNTTGGPYTTFCEIVSTLNGAPLGYMPKRSITFALGNDQVELQNGPMNTDATFIVYNNTSVPDPNAIRAASNFTFCNATAPDLNITGAALQKVTLKFVARDAPTSPTNHAICNNAVFFRPGSICGAGGGGYGYGGNLTLDPMATDVGMVNMYQVDPFGQTCIRLFYGKNTMTTVTQYVDFFMDLSDLSGTINNPVATITTGTTTTTINIQVQYFSSGNYFLIILPTVMNGVSTITSCT